MPENAFPPHARPRADIAETRMADDSSPSRSEQPSMDERAREGDELDEILSVEHALDLPDADPPSPPDASGPDEDEEILPPDLGFGAASFEPVAFTPATPLFGLAPVEAPAYEAMVDGTDTYGDDELEDLDDGGNAAPNGAPAAGRAKHRPPHHKKRHSARGGRGAHARAARPARKPAVGRGPSRGTGNGQSPRGGAKAKAVNPNISREDREKAKFLLRMFLAGLFFLCVLVGTYRLPWLLNKKLIWPWSDIVRHVPFLRPAGYVEPARITVPPPSSLTSPKPARRTPDDPREISSETYVDPDITPERKGGTFKFDDD